MKRIFLSFALIWIASFAFSQEITGKWLTDDGEAIVEIYKINNKVNGKIVWLKKPNDENGKPLKDIENPDRNKRNQYLLGLLILSDFKQMDNKWEDGKIYGPSEGETYKCTMWVYNDKLKVRGYLGMLYQTQTWTKIK